LNIFNYIDWALDYFGIESSDNILSTSLFHFDMSVFDIYAPLFSGAKLTLAPDGMVVFPNRVMDLIERKGVTIWKASSSIFSYFVKLRALKPNRMNTLRKIVFSGEALATKLLAEWMKTYPDKTFFNAYGPSECTGISTCYQVPRIPENLLEAIPIGKACANSEVFAVKENGETAGEGEAGELCIRSSSVSAGYWNDAGKTEQAFLDNPRRPWGGGDRLYRTGDLVKRLPDGNFVFMGRIDEQVKISGYRIEIGEVERALQAIQGVEEGAVIPVEDEVNDGIQLVSFVGSSNKTMDCEDLLAILRESLPKYMVPTKICFLPQLPRSQNGKVDKRKLRDLWATVQSDERKSTEDPSMQGDPERG
jgi:acyl-coenzyme A synthetase/AMP-(fatty) acid ligase